MVRTESATDIYGEVSNLQDIREINKKIRSEMTKVREREELTELKKRSDYLCALTLAPSWRTRFGRRSARFLEVAREEDEKSTKAANEIARKKGFDVEYHAWGGE
jgi:hypothetical protein